MAMLWGGTSRRKKFLWLILISILTGSSAVYAIYAMPADLLPLPIRKILPSHSVAHTSPRKVTGSPSKPVYRDFSGIVGVRESEPDKSSAPTFKIRLPNRTNFENNRADRRSPGEEEPGNEKAQKDGDTSQGDVYRGKKKKDNRSKKDVKKFDLDLEELGEIDEQQVGLNLDIEDEELPPNDKENKASSSFLGPSLTNRFGRLLKEQGGVNSGLSNGNGLALGKNGGVSGGSLVPGVGNGAAGIAKPGLGLGRSNGNGRGNGASKR